MLTMGLCVCGSHYTRPFSSIVIQDNVVSQVNNRIYSNTNTIRTINENCSGSEPPEPVLRAWTTFNGSRRHSVGSCTCQNTVLCERAGPSNGAYQMTPDKRPPHTTCSSFARNHFIWSVRLQITVMPKPKLYELQQIHDFCAGGKFL